MGVEKRGRGRGEARGKGIHACSAFLNFNIHYTFIFIQNFKVTKKKVKRINLLTHMN